jgi:hypothetical protein
MTNKKATAPTVAHGSIAAPILSVPDAAATPAARFLDLLGKDPETTRLRTFLGKGAKSSWNLKKAAEWNQNGAGVYVVINDGGDTDAQITSCPALFVDWDDGASIEVQRDRWQVLNLPEPTVMVWTGGKSVHCYWVLQEPMAPAEWRPLQKRLIDYCKGDKACGNPSRVMRLPGFIYEKNPAAKALCRILENPSGNRYKAEDLEAALPVEVASKPPVRTLEVLPGGLSGDLPPRGIEAINEAAGFIPRRVGDQGTYPSDRNALCGCSAALHEAGHTDPDGAALALLGHLWPDESAAAQVLKSTSTREAKSFWAIAKEHGYDLKRPTSPPTQHAQQLVTPQPPSKPQERKARRMSHSKAMACLERCVEVQAKRERNSLRRRARLLKAAKDLGLAAFINRQEIAQKVLEAKARCGGEGFKPLTAADRAAMQKPVVRWLMPGLLPAGDMSIIGGRPKVGKTRLAVAMVAAVLRGESFLSFSAPTTAPPVLLVTDDQSDGDTADMLTALDLWQHPRLIWSRSFRLTETDLQALLDTMNANPGSLVVLDSLRSIGRALQHGENDPEIGATLYDLKQAVIEAGGTLLLIHHCNKAADLFGTEALSGHNAIAGAANTVLTMHYLPGENGQPNKSSTERRLFREARSGEGFDLVVGRDRNTFRKVATVDQWQQQAKEAKQASRVERVTPLQQQIKEALDAVPEAWMTRRQVCEAIDVKWSNRGRNTEARRVGDALQRLVEVKAVESARSGTEATYRASHEHNRTTRTSQPISHANGFQLSNQTPDNPDNPDSDVVCLSMSGLSQNAPDTENGSGDWLARLSGLSDAPSHPLGVLEIGAAVEHQGAEGWRNGWTVADVVPTNIGTRYRIVSGGDYRVVGSDQIRPCVDAA